MTDTSPVGVSASLLSGQQPDPGFRSLAGGHRPSSTGHRAGGFRWPGVRSAPTRNSSRNQGPLCEKNAVTHNPVKGVKRPKAESGEGKTPALGDHQARELLVAPGKDAAAGEETIKQKRDRAILSTRSFTRCGARNCAS